MSSGLAAFPATLPSGTVVGRVAIGAGPAEAVSLTALLAAMTGGTSYIGQIVTKRKTADQAVVSSTVLVNDNELTFAVAANEEWIGSLYLSVSAPVVGPKVALAVPSGATLEADGFLASVSTTIIGRSTTSGGTIFSGSGNAADVGLVYFWVLNGTNAGSITLQWAQTASTGTSTGVRKGSFLQATRVA